MSIDFTAVDFSTGNKQICAIGAVKVRNGEIVDTYYQEVNPDVGQFRPNDHLVNGGYTEQSVKNAPVFPDIYPHFMDFIGDDILVGVFKPLNPENTLDRAVTRYHLKALTNSWFDIRVFFDNCCPGHRKSPVYLDQNSGLNGISRWVLDMKKPDSGNNPKKDAEIIAQATVKLCANVEADSLVQADINSRVFNDYAFDSAFGQMGMRFPEDVPYGSAIERSYAVGIHDALRDQGFQYWKNDRTLEIVLDTGGYADFTGIELRVLRDELGIPLELLAQMTETDPNVIVDLENKEHPTLKEEYLYCAMFAVLRVRKEMLADVRFERFWEAVDASHDLDEEELRIAYFRDQEHYIACNSLKVAQLQDDMIGFPCMRYEVFNAVSRELHNAADMEQIPVTYHYPEDSRSTVF